MNQYWEILMVKTGYWTVWTEHIDTTCKSRRYYTDTGKEMDAFTGF